MAGELGRKQVPQPLASGHSGACQHLGTAFSIGPHTRQPHEEKN